MPRTRRAESEWQEILKEYSQSGEKQAVWCEAKNINVNTFRSQKVKMRKRTKRAERAERAELKPVTERGVTPLQWMSLSQETRSAAGKIRVKLGRFTIMIEADFSERELSRVCKTLVELC